MTSLSTYEFSTLYTTLPRNFIKDKLIDVTERTFQREDSLYVTTRIRFSLNMHGHVKMYVMC